MINRKFTAVDQCHLRSGVVLLRILMQLHTRTYAYSRSCAAAAAAAAVYGRRRVRHRELESARAHNVDDVSRSLI